ncbi:MAG: family 43 glycosylhydrolase [Flavisolibacter sp.]
MTIAIKKLLFIVVAASPLCLLAQQRSSVEVDSVVRTRDLPVHDPVMIRQGKTFYLFCTGFGISVWSSKDLNYWRKEAPVFSKPPQWAVNIISNFKGHTWAPDISFHNAQYYLYYAVSTFGKNTSAIGVATNKSLDPSSPDFKWIDHGSVIQSYAGKTNWNAIDPNLVEDDKQNAFLVFGSFWDGVKLVRLTKDLLHPAEAVSTIPTIASRKKHSSDKNDSTLDNHSKEVVDNAIEAPFIFKKKPYYYLFASIDYCCRGEQSTYKVIVGRSKNVRGPYVDERGLRLRAGGGTILVQGNDEWYGVGHNAVYTSEGMDYIIYHGYDAKDKGKSKLIIKKLRWNQDKWPVVEDISE